MKVARGIVTRISFDKWVVNFCRRDLSPLWLELLPWGRTMQLRNQPWPRRHVLWGWSDPTDRDVPWNATLKVGSSMWISPGRAVNSLYDSTLTSLFYLDIWCRSAGESPSSLTEIFENLLIGNTCWTPYNGSCRSGVSASDEVVVR